MKIVGFFVGSNCRKLKRLLQVFLNQIGIIAKDLFAITIRRQNLKHTPDSDPHPPNARFAPVLPGLYGDSIKSGNL